jgi:tetratricopeptide (TPR) repeat protein
MKDLIHEIHRRSLWQVLGIYVVGSWIVFQVAQTLTEGLGLPDWVPPFALILLLMGLPIVVATAFVQEGGPRGATDQDPSIPGQGEPVDAQPPRTASPEADSRAPGHDEGRTPAGAPPGALTKGESSGGRAVHHRLFTWRNAVMGGVVAFALLGLGTAGYMALRTLGIGPAGTLVAKGLLEERATIIISDFASTDSTLARRMERPAEGGLDFELARQLAQREGVPAVIGGEINPAGGGFVLTANLVRVETGEVLTSQRSAAEDEGEVVSAIDRLSSGLRERIGESLRSIRSNPPLEQVTTPDLEALRKYSQAVRVIDIEGPSPRALALLEDAVGLDTAFAMAWRQLGTELLNRREERERGVAALRKAFDHQDRLTERERYVTRASYFSHATHENEKGVLELQRLLELDPQDHFALNNLGVAYAELRDFERAAEYFERAARAEPESFRPLSNLIEVEADLGLFGPAEARLDSAAARFGETVPIVWFQSHLAATRGDHERALERSRHLWREQAVTSLDLRSLGGSDLGSLTGALGRLTDAGRYLDDAMAERGARSGRAVSGQRHPEGVAGRLRARGPGRWCRSRDARAPAVAPFGDLSSRPTVPVARRAVCGSEAA